MSSGANQDRPEEAAKISPVPSAPQLVRGRVPVSDAANDNSADWRSVWSRHVVRPLRRLAAALLQVHAWMKVLLDLVLTRRN